MQQDLVAGGRRRALAWRSLWGQALYRRAMGRLSWGVADQAVSSLTNFAVSIYVARNLGAAAFGAFGLAYVTYAFVLNASRGLGTEPLMVRYSNAGLAKWRQAVSACAGTALAIGLVTGGCALAVSPVLPGKVRLAFLALGLTLPGLMLQDSWRYSFFTLGRGHLAFVNDTIWLIALFPALAAVRASGHRDVFWVVVAWGAAAGLAAVAGAWQARALPSLRKTSAWLRQHRDLGPRFLAESAATSVTTQLRSYTIGGILGLAAVGYVQAANTLMGPVMMLFLGMGLVTTPEAARVLDSSPRRLALFCLLISALLSVVAIGWSAVLLIELPRGLGRIMLGPLWRPTYPLVLPQALFVLGMCVSTGSGAGLHALGAARRSLRAMLIGSAFSLVCAMTGALTGGTAGTVKGAALGSWLGVAVWWGELFGALREAGITSGRHRKSRRGITGQRSRLLTSVARLSFPDCYVEHPIAPADPADPLARAATRPPAVQTRIGFACLWEPVPERTWSGSASNIRAALGAIAPVTDLGVQLPAALRGALRLTHARFLGGRPTSTWCYSSITDAYITRALSSSLRRQACDAVLSIDDVAPVDIPFFTYYDSSWDSLMTCTRDEQVHAAIRKLSPRIVERRRQRQLEVYSAATGVVAMSHWLASSLIRQSGVAPDKVHVVHAGISANRLSRAPVPERAAPRRKLLFVGRQYAVSDFYRKGGDLVVAALAILRREYDPHITLTVVGTQSWPLPGDIPDGVRLLGVLPPEQVAGLYDSHDLFVMPSRLEPFGVVFAEALSRGLPCVARSAFAMPEIVTPGVSGALIDGDDPRELAATIAGVLDSDAIYASCRRRAPLIAEYFSWERAAVQMAALISVAISRKQGRS